MDDHAKLRYTLRDAQGRQVNICETRREMLRSTSRFLSRALRGGVRLRIPRRRMDRGGFAPILRRRGARALVNRWWSRVLESDVWE